MAVRGLDHLRIANRPAGLDDGRYARLGRALDAIREWEEGVGGHDRANAAIARLAAGDVHAVDAAHLTRANPNEHQPFREHDGVRSDVLHRPPGEQQAGQLLERRPTDRYDIARHLALGDGVTRLNQKAPGHPLVVEIRRLARTGAVVRGRGAGLHHTQVLLLLQHFERVG